MLANSLRLRGLQIAFLFGPPRVIERDEAALIHSAVCHELKQDDLGFRYQPSGDADKPSSRGMSITFDRKEGRGQFSVSIQMPSVNMPIRLLLSYDYPPSLHPADEAFDMAYGAIFRTLSGTWTRVLAEVRLYAQCDTREKSGLGFITQTFLKLDEQWLAELGKPLISSSVKFLVGATSPTGGNQLEGPTRNLQIEVLREDPRCVYLELTHQWPQLPVISMVPPQTIDFGAIRRIDEKPSDYVREAYNYLTVCVESLSKKGKP
jgi:hypothetical protein